MNYIGNTTCQTLSNIENGNVIPVDITNNSTVSYNSSTTECTITINVCQILNAKNFVYGVLMGVYPPGVTDLSIKGPKLIGNITLPNNNGMSAYIMSLTLVKSPIVIGIVKSDTSITTLENYNFGIFTTDVDLDTVFENITHPELSSDHVTSLSSTLENILKTSYSLKIPSPNISGFTNPTKNNLLQGYYKSNLFGENEYFPFSK